jgi:hypothetical protein
MPWRLLLAVVGVVLAAIMLFSFAVGFGSSTAAKPSTVTNTQVNRTPDSIDRSGGTTNPQVVGTPDSIDRIDPASSDAVLLNCHVNQPC